MGLDPAEVFYVRTVTRGEIIKDLNDQLCEPIAEDDPRMTSELIREYIEDLVTRQDTKDSHDDPSWEAHIPALEWLAGKLGLKLAPEWED